jgi:hypothetical protein
MHSDKKLLVYTHGASRLGNQLFAYAHFIAFFEEHPGEFDFINFSFVPYAKFLKETSKNLSYIHSTKYHSLKIFQTLSLMLEVSQVTGAVNIIKEKIIYDISRLLHAYSALAPNCQSLLVNDIYELWFMAGQHMSYLDLALPDTFQLLQSKALTVLAGWGIRSWTLLEKHKAAVQEKLAFHPKYETVARNFVNSLRKKYDFLVGIAIRQGDYRTCEDFKCFLFETKQYIKWIQQAREAFSAKGRVGFIITADEPQEINQFAGLNVHFATGIAGGKGHYIESLIELSLCDLLIASGTTFAGWAAFYGDIPLIPLHDVKQEIKIEDIQCYFEAFKLFDKMGNKIL